MKRTVAAGLAAGALLLGGITVGGTGGPVVRGDDVQLVANNSAARAQCEGREIPRRVGAVLQSRRFQGRALADAIRREVDAARADCLRRYPDTPTTTTTPRPPSTTPRPPSTTPRPPTTTPRPPTTTTPPVAPPSGGNSRSCSDGAVMTYDTTGPTFGVSLDCSRSGDAPPQFSYTGQGNFYGSVRVSTTCPTGSFQVRSGGDPQGAAGGDYYRPQYSVDGRTVSYDFSGKAGGTQTRWYVSGSCRATVPTTTEPGTCTTSRRDDGDGFYTRTEDCPAVLPAQSGTLRLDCDGNDYFSSYALDDPAGIAAGEVTIPDDPPFFASVHFDNTTTSPQPLQLRVSCQHPSEG